jgi:uncharacterized protein YukE
MSALQIERIRAYRDDIARRLQEVEHRRENLIAAWQRLRQAYQGEGAEAFNQQFQRAIRRFEQQAQRLHLILPRLEAMLEQLTASSQ